MRPSGLVVAKLYDDRHRFGSYWPTLRKLSVPVPATRVVSLPEAGLTSVVGSVTAFMRREGLSQAFVRSGFKAAPRRLRDGSLVHERSRAAVESTLRSLLNQHAAAGVPHGNEIVVRRRLDLDYCRFPAHNHAAELRFFVEDGSILRRAGRIDTGLVPDCRGRYDHVVRALDTAESPEDIVETVADGLADDGYPWTVDVVLDAHGEWWVTELHLDGVRWDDDAGQWRNICGQEDRPGWGPVWTHGAALPTLRDS
jgi:hypothetical protein